MPFLFDIFSKSGKKDKKNKSDDLAQSFDHLTLAPEVRPQFVGGFNARLNSGSPNTRRDVFKPLPSMPPATRPRPQGSPAFPLPTHVSLPQPPSVYPTMPVPQSTNQQYSLTMQHALYNNSNPGSMPGRLSHSVLPQHRDCGVSIPPATSNIPTKAYVINNNNLTVPNQRPQHSRPNSDSALPSRPTPASLPSTPAKVPPSSSSLPKLTPPANRRPRASSTPASTTAAPSNDGTTQCSGVTKAGKRCTRQVKSGPPLSVVHPDVQLERFCFQHTKEVMAPSGFYSRRTGSDWIKFEDWIPDYLQPDTQVALRTEMEKSRSHSDVPGYIYTFEIRDSATPQYIHLKVGRATNLVKRLDQWDKQCGSKEKEQVLRGWWPGTVDPEGAGNAGESLMKGRIQAGEKGLCCHRLERLVHLELADLALFQPYLDSAFPNAGPSMGTATPNGGASANVKKKCLDCGTTHKEIFTFKRVEAGDYQDKEWELIVRPVIEKWGAFVEAYV